MPENYYPLTDEVLEGIKNNPYFVGHKGDQLVFTKDFYVEMYKKVVLEGRTYVEAYNELGFDTTFLGEARANAVGMRIMKLAEDHRLFRIDFRKIQADTADFGIMPDQEAVYLLCERVDFMRQLLESLQVAQGVQVVQETAQTAQSTI